MRKKSATRTNQTSVVALSVSPDDQDHNALQQLFDASNWVLYRANSVWSALSLLRKYEIGVILCECDLDQYTWINMLEEVNKLSPDAPPLIVTSRLADERLWVEALNLGAYDVLAKPFYTKEVVRSVNLAWLHWVYRHDTRTAIGFSLFEHAFIVKAIPLPVGGHSGTDDVISS